MRILFILHQFFPEFHGGTERVTLNMARMAQHAGHYVHVLASTVEPEKCLGSSTEASLPGSYESTYLGVPVTLMPRSALPATADISLDVDLQVTESLVTWMRDQRFDVVHVFHTMRMGSAVLAAQRSEIPYVVTLTDFFLPCARINLIDVGGKLCTGPEGRHPMFRDLLCSTLVRSKLCNPIRAKPGAIAGCRRARCPFSICGRPIPASLSGARVPGRSTRHRPSRYRCSRSAILAALRERKRSSP